MRIVSLAKELGMPYEKVLDWCRNAGMPYQEPEDEVTSGHMRLIRSAFHKPPVRQDHDEEDPDLSLDDLELIFGDDSDLDLDDLPQSMEELEDLERSIFKGASKAGPKKPKADRLLVQAILKKFGLENRGTIKKVRKLLPEHISRLLNHESLAEEQSRMLHKALEEKITFWCGDRICRELLTECCSEKELIPTQEEKVCTLCAGSSIRRGMEIMAKALREKEIRHVVIVGGAPASHKELNAYKPQGLTFKLIEGDVSRDKQRAAADLKWCDLAVIWAGTILGHEVSQNYLRGSRNKVVIVKRRSIEALCDTVVEWVKGNR